ncbi:hypothetical protein O7605_11025 [Verrucosispora sp. WMMA2121]|uniref:hypothetical protein n=1 Tax=Verrucosispora sp. WMMA2121 TaxID=3015164 RepID=UPI0022B74FD6|nr:hypothetical protein [Verrucosispora sp. WMMA2121]MCZ7420050.1 hypothetical protein [Verrucosispora sp. WMMA2121]
MAERNDHGSGAQRAGQSGLLRRVRPSRRADPRPPTPASVVLAALAAHLPVRSRTAVPCSAPYSDQPGSLAAGGRAVTGGSERMILAVHVRGLDGMCVGCRAWWSRLAPYPCWQVDWATSRQARASVARFLGGVR